MVKKMVLRPSAVDLLRGVNRNGLQGIGRPFSNLVVQTPHEQEDGEYDIPSMDVINAMTELDANLSQADLDLAQAKQDIEAANELIEQNRLLAEQKFSELDDTIGNIELGGGQYTISEVDPTAADGTGKPTNAVWEVRSGTEALRRFVWDGTAWSTYEAGADFIAADKVAAAVGVFIDAMMENLSVTGVAAIQQVTTDALWAKLAVVDRLQVMTNIITRDMVATGAITGNKLTVDAAAVAKLVAQSGWFGEVTAKKMTSSEFIGGTITGAVVRTAASGARTVMDTSGVTVYNSSNQAQTILGQGIEGGLGQRFNNEIIPLSKAVFGSQYAYREEVASYVIGPTPAGREALRRSGNAGVSLTFTPWASTLLVTFGYSHLMYFTPQQGVNRGYWAWYGNVDFRQNGQTIERPAITNWDKPRRIYAGGFSGNNSMAGDTWGRTEMSSKEEYGSFYLSVTPGTAITLSNAFSFYVVNQSESRANNRFGILDAWISVQQIQ